MMTPDRISRRRILGGLSAATLSLSLPSIAQSDQSSSTGRSWLRKTLKDGMLQVNTADQNPWPAKFELARSAGFEGVEITTRGGLDTDAARRAADAVGIVIDGTVGGYHWSIRHTDPDRVVRKRAQAELEQSLQQTAALGAKTFLIVPGHGRDGSSVEVNDRATAAIETALPLAERLGVAILVENVWNHFLYDHQGDASQSAEPLADFIDSFGSPRVGTQFDLGNHWKYGDIADWIRTLGRRIQKLDIKGFSRANDRFTDITEGDVDWPAIQAALVDIKFTGWLAAEVGGGGLKRLQKVAAQMDAALDGDATLTSLQSRVSRRSKSNG